MKRIYKYGTGQEIPVGAVYLTTLTETKKEKRTNSDDNDIEYTENYLVWHYFLVGVTE